MVFFQSLTQAELADLLLPLSDARIPSAKRAGMSPQELEEATAQKRLKQARYRARQIFVWVYQRLETDWERMSDLSKELRAWLQQNVEIYRPSEKLSQQSLDGTHKFLWNLNDGKTIESVIIPAALREKGQDAFDEQTESAASQFAGEQSDDDLESDRWTRLTACISSQVGCAMACKFCLTGIQGLDRHLEVHEIVAQVHELRRRAPITNIVFMGMGEPLHNIDNVAKACNILLDGDGLNFSRRKITVSTSGLVPAIRKLAELTDVHLAVSLNATTDETRSLIMPVNKKWNIAELLSACRDYPQSQHRRITFEYVLLKGINDTLEDAQRLYEISRTVLCKINLIPFNEHSGSEFKRPSDAVVKGFQHYLVSRGVTATVRISRGRDILAACGQLRSLFGTARGTDRHKDWTSAPAQLQS